MVNEKKKSAAPSYTAQEPFELPARPARIPAADIEKELDAAIEAQDNVRALEVLDAAPQWMKKQPVFMLMRASVLLALGHESEAFRLFRETERKNPRFWPLYLPLAAYYMDQDWPAHALKAAKQALSNSDLTGEDRADLEQIIEQTTAYIQNDADEFGLPFETMQRASIFHEQGQMAMNENKLSEADHYSREAIKIAPNWDLPHNNRAQALYYSGKTTEAIALSEAVVARSPENTFALSHLVIYHLGLNQNEPALEYANRLYKLSGKFSPEVTPDSTEIDLIISGLAATEDTPALWKIARRYLDAPSEALFGRTWQILAVAAVRSEKWKDALTLIRKAIEEELLPSGKDLLEELEEVAHQRSPRLAWMPPAYPGAELFLYSRPMEEWEALAKTISVPVSPSQKRKIDSFYQKYPFMLAGMKRLLWGEGSHPIALSILEQMETPEADAEILRFALSQTGPRDARLQAIMALIQDERYNGPKVVKLWDEDLEEWRDIELNLQRIGDTEANAQPKTIALIEKARKAKDPQETIAYLQEAIALEPTSPIATFNLGVTLTQTGKIQEGEALIWHSVEIDPNYTFGHAMIALVEAGNSHEQEALDHLQVVTHADVIDPETAVIANLAWFTLAIHKNDLKMARQHLELAALIDPEHRLLEDYEEMLEKAETFSNAFGSLIEYQRESIQRAHKKLLKTPLTAEMGLRACLETNTKDMLVGIAHFLRTSSSGKKGELVSWLAERLMDGEFLQETLDEDLQAKEREALQWLLEAGGVRPWKDFAGKYGDDMDESTAWNYKEPVSIPGRLRMTGLFYTGLLDGQQVAFIPADMRPLLREQLK